MKQKEIKKDSKKSTRSSMKVSARTKQQLDRVKRSLTDMYGLKLAVVGIVRLSDEETVLLMMWMLRKGVGIDELEILTESRLENAFKQGGK